MSALFLQRSIPPDHSAAGVLVLELAEFLATKGFDVSIVASREPRDAPPREIRNGVTVTRAAALPFSRSSLLSRAIALASVYPALFLKALFSKRTDFLITLSDPPLLVVLGAMIARWKGNRHIHWCQDVYPEVAEAAGILNPHGAAANFLRGISTSAMNSCNAVVVVGECMRNTLIARGVQESKIHVIPNWTNPVEIHPDPAAAAAFRKKHSLTGKFVIMYSGNFGVAHSFDGLAAAAITLQKDSPEVRFVFVGGGPRLAELKQTAVPNMLFLPSQPRENLNALLNAADVHLVTLRKEMSGLVVPSKIYSILAAGKPCLFAGPAKSEVARLLTTGMAGIVASENDSESLQFAIREFQKPDRAAEYSKHALAVGTECGIAPRAQAFEKLLT